jgi:hypothetical protein
LTVRRRLWHGRGRARQARIQYPGATCDVMSRGDRRQDIFLNAVDRQDFLKTPAQARRKTGWEVHAWVGRNWTWPHGPSATPASWGIALRLRRETTLSVREIAARLHLGAPASASVCLLAAMRKGTSGVPAQGRLEV